MNRIFRWTASSGVLLALASFVGGCQWQDPKTVAPEKERPAQSAVVHLPPKELVKLIAADVAAPPLSLSVASVQDGTITTGWKEYEGAVHIVRRWQERSRFRINVLPDFGDPTGTSHIDVFDETEEKPSDGQPWYPNPDLRRPERSAQLIAIIVEHEPAKK